MANVNVIILVLDALRPDHLSCYGYERETSPNIDRLARQGLVFQNAVSQAGWTLPSHASLFTGLFPAEHGATDEHHFLDPQIPTLADLLSSRGYDCLCATSNAWISETTGMTRGFGDVCQPSLYSGIKKIANAARKRYLDRDHGAATICRYVKKWLGSRSPDRPFFVFMNLLEAHTPYHVPNSFIKPYLPRGVNPAGALGINQDCDAYMAGKAPMSSDDFEILRSVYCGAISYLDKQLGDLWAYLESLGQAENTLLAITADHGENFGDHGLMGHRFCLYDSLIKVPLIVKGPGIGASEKPVEPLTQLIDIPCTILDLAGMEDIPERSGMSGLNLLKIASSEEQHPFVVSLQSLPNLTVYERDHPDFDPSLFNKRIQSIRTLDYKYIAYSDGTEELFNLKKDQVETENLKESEPEKIKHFRAVLDDWSKRYISRGQEGGPEMDEKMKKSLEQLGYIV